MLEDFVVGDVADFEPGDKVIVEIGGRSVGVFRTGDEFYAAQNMCPHALAPICLSNLSGTALPSEPGEWKYGMDGLVLRCPWHAWEFDIRTGEALSGTDRRRVATFPVKVEDGKVIVTMRPKRQRNATGESVESDIASSAAEAPTGVS